MKRAAVLAAGIVALVLAGQAEAKTLTFCSEGSPAIDPALYVTPATFDASSQTIYDRLVAFEPGTTNIVPALAERWDISPDGLEYTFHLRGKVEFHLTGTFIASRPFNADDVVFSFERQMKTDSPFYSYAGGIWGYFTAMSMGQRIAMIEKIDDATVKFTLARPDAAFLADLAMDFASILSKEYADQLRKDGKLELLNREPVGTGPFAFVDYEKDAKIRFEANDEYWAGKPKIDALTFLVTPDPAERLKKLRAGDCQVMDDPDPADIDGLKKDAALQILQIENPDISYLAYNTTQKPFDDPRVRKALNMAIDKPAIVEAIYKGDARVAKNPMPPTLWSYNAAVTDDPYDPDGAKKLLAEAGVTDLKMKIWALPVGRSYNPDAANMAAMIKADFAKVGVTVTDIVSPEIGAYFKNSAAKDRDGAVLLGWTGDSGDPDDFLPVLLGCDGVGGTNRAQWCDQPFQDLVVKAKAATDRTERARVYEQAQAIFKEQAPWATLAHSLATTVLAKAVTGYKMDPLGHHRFDKVDMAE